MPLAVASEGPEILQADFLEERFHLTHAEARLVGHLVAGASLRSCAKALGIKYETARSYLKSAFLKTGTHRQAELVLRVFHTVSDPNPPAVPPAIGAQELRTAVQKSRTEQARPTETRLATVTTQRAEATLAQDFID